MSVARPLAWAFALAAGLGSELVGPWSRDVTRWLPDLAAGMALVTAGLLSWGNPRLRGASFLLLAAGAAWFAGNVAGAAAHWHRAPLIHLVVAYPLLRPPSRAAAGIAVLAYGAALLALPLSIDAPAVLLAAAALAVAAHAWRRATGRLRTERLAALACGLIYVAAVALGAFVRQFLPAGQGLLSAIVVYEAALVGIAVVLAVEARRPATAAMADAVVEIGEAPSGSVRDKLAGLLRDDQLTLASWSAQASTYVDGYGVPVQLPTAGSTQTATLVSRDGKPLGAVIHDAAVPGSHELVEAVAAATQLADANASLRRRVAGQVAELTASRRRLLVIADEERAKLEERLRAGPARALSEVGQNLPPPGVLADQPELAAAIEDVRRQLELTVADLRELARGLHPRELTEGGLSAALGQLANRSPLEVRLTGDVGRLAPEIEATAYFVCAEALANAIKHSGAQSLSIRISSADDHLTVVVVDDGIGGADLTSGSGLRGLRDRLEALGGELRISSEAGAGTQIRAGLPLDRQSRLGPHG